MSSIVKDMLHNYYTLDFSSKIDIDRALQQVIVDDRDGKILRLFMNGETLKSISEITHVGTTTVKRTIDNIAEAIANILGEEYKDDRIIRAVSLKLKRALSKEEIEFCWQVIKSGRSLAVDIFSLEDRNGHRASKT